MPKTDKKFAVIDIGSNSVRLMLWANGPLYKKVCTTRLAEGLSQSGMLCGAAIARTVDAVVRFAEEGEHSGARVLAFATAAVRASSNSAAFCKAVKMRCGKDVDVVSGEEEALLGLCGAAGAGDGGIIDIGGASTEICRREGGKIVQSVSLPIGAVRLSDECGQDKTANDRRICSVLETLGGVRPTCRMYAIGGTASVLASVRLKLRTYSAQALNHVPLTREWIEEEAETLFALSAEERKSIPGMEPARADIIAGGAAILAAVVRRLDIGTVYFSDADNLEGYLVVRGFV